MAFDFENAVLQGWARDYTLNDWAIEARNAEIILEDAGGVSEFRILDSDNVAVVVADSDGYLAIAGNAEVNGGHVTIKGESLVNTEFITLKDQFDEASIFLADADPNGVVGGTRGSIALNYNDGYVYSNVDDGTTWIRFALASEISGATNLQIAYKNDVDGADAIITTDGADGSVVIAGTESFRITAIGGLDLDTGFDMDGAGPFDVDITGAVSIDGQGDSNFTTTDGNIIINVINTGDIINRLTSPGSDFVVDQGAGSEFIRAETSVNELRLGDDSPTPINVNVLNDMVIQGDLTVNGTTTNVNTEDLFVEDRLIRLNVGAAPSFSGTTGLELEVGSDGYVEFHWDDTQGRWEFSIDRNTTPEAQTFRPIPYLADAPGTLDLSSLGTDGYAPPNVTSGASVVNTNRTNFPNTFGGFMINDSVQGALEAIDGYFQFVIDEIDEVNAGVTLQVAYDNDIDGGGASIITNATDGNVIIAGTEALQVTATGGIDLDTIFDMDGSTFDVSLTGAASIDSVGAANFTTDTGTLTLSTTTSGDVAVTAATNVDVDGTDILLDATNSISLDAAAASNFTTSAGTLTLDGAAGVILDGNGSNVIPAVNNIDTLGSATNGWADVYLANVVGDQTVALRAAGANDVNNVTSGAHAVGTNNLNYNTFGPDMSDDSVQAALEAIDGYFVEVTNLIQDAGDFTLQEAYDNSPAPVTILTNAGSGPLIIAGTESLNVTAVGGIDLDSGFDMDATGGESFDINLTGGGSISMDAYGANSNITVDAADLFIGTTTSGVLTLDGATGIVLDGNGEGVRPEGDRTDELGREDAGWSNIYLANVVGDQTVGLGDAGGDNVNNVTSGAHAVGTNSNNFNTFGPDMSDNSVQAALEAIDGYLSNITLDNLDTSFEKCEGVDLFGGLSNGRIKNRDVSGTPALEYKRNQLGRVQWTIPVPSDWDGLSDIDVEVIWSASDSGTGDVAWRLEYKSLSTTELASSAITTVDFNQAASGTSEELQSTANNLTIPAADILVSDDIIVFNVVRRGNAGADTYNNDVRVHLVKYCYTAENIIS